MDASTLVACFDASFSPNANIRIASELELRKVSWGCVVNAKESHMLMEVLFSNFIHTRADYNYTSWTTAYVVYHAI